MSVIRPPPMYIRASCVRLSQVQRRRRGESYGAATMRCQGDVAEWLGRGLQSLVQRFESARRLSFPRVRTSPEVTLLHREDKRDEDSQAAVHVA